MQQPLQSGGRHYGLWQSPVYISEGRQFSNNICTYILARVYHLYDQLAITSLEKSGLIGS